MAKHSGVIRVLYRMSSRCGRASPEWFTNRSCFLNFKENFPDTDIYAVLDNADESCVQIMEDTGTPYESIAMGNAPSFFRLLDIISHRVDCGEYGIDDIIYIVENDYCHRRGSKAAILDGMTIADYATLYDHPDKYPEVTFEQDHCGVLYSDIRSKVWLGRTGHWRSTTSTTGTFASTARIILDDMDMFRKWVKLVDVPEEKPKNDSEATYQGTGAWKIGVHDCPLFHKLVLVKHRSLISSIPGYSTHGDWFSPYVNWQEEMRVSNINNKERVATSA